MKHKFNILMKDRLEELNQYMKCFHTSARKKIPRLNKHRHLVKEKKRKEKKIATIKPISMTVNFI